MLAHVVRRLAPGMFTIWAISVLAFVIIELPEGDLASKRYGRTTFAFGEGAAHGASRS